MANELRKRINFIAGTLSANMPIGSTTMQSAELTIFPAIDSTQHAVAIVGSEIMWIIAHTASSSSATVLRGQETTDPNQSHFAGDRWEHGPTVYDFNVYVASALGQGMTIGSNGQAVSDYITFDVIAYWGIDGSNNPYFDSGGAAAGQEAALSLVNIGADSSGIPFFDPNGILVLTPIATVD